MFTKYKLTLCLISLILISASCNETTFQNSEREIILQSVISPDTVNLGIPFEIEFEFSAPGCETYSRFELEKTNEDLFLTVFIKNLDDANCFTGIFKEKVKEEIQIHSSGEINLIINDSTIVKTIHVNP